MNPTIDHLITLAFQEDIGPGDITTDYLVDCNQKGVGTFLAKQDTVVAGSDIAVAVFKRLDPSCEVTIKVEDGQCVNKGETILTVNGKLKALLKGERTALNFMQRLSGIATNVRRYVDELDGCNVKLVDTRKTIPGWRYLEKYAVRMGGALNHRMALYDGVLIKDNHIAVSGGIIKAVEKIRQKVSHLVKIEVEVSDEAELSQALEAGADIIMLDNMSLDKIQKCVKIIDGRAIVEVSGSVTLDRLRQLAETGVDIISSGALTHQAQAVDISMRIAV